MEDKCICCGKPVPEGRMVCYECERKDNQNCNGLFENSKPKKNQIKPILNTSQFYKKNI